jgi:hypothetical protein
MIEVRSVGDRCVRLMICCEEAVVRLEAAC